MYKLQIVKRKMSVSEEEINKLKGISLNKNKEALKIKGTSIKNIIITDKKIVLPLLKSKIFKKYQKLLNEVVILLDSEDDDGSNLLLALDKIERFRAIIKNKYRNYLEKSELEFMAHKLKILKKEIKNRYLGLELDSKNKNQNRGK